MEKTSREKQFTIVGKVVRQSKAKGVLIKVVWSKQNGEGNCAKTSGIGSILLEVGVKVGCVSLGR